MARMQFRLIWVVECVSAHRSETELTCSIIAARWQVLYLESFSHTGLTQTRIPRKKRRRYSLKVTYKLKHQSVSQLLWVVISAVMFCPAAHYQNTERRKKYAAIMLTAYFCHIKDECWTMLAWIIKGMNEDLMRMRTVNWKNKWCWERSENNVCIKPINGMWIYETNSSLDIIKTSLFKPFSTL